jgi:hypothetical protein
MELESIDALRAVCVSAKTNQMANPMGVRGFRATGAAVMFGALLMFPAFVVPSVHAQVVLQSHSAGAVDYVTGGIGKDEADMLKQASADYALTVELASSGPLPTDEGTKGYYVSGATVDIRDSAGRSVLTTTTDGPLLLARLPDGVYTIDTAWNGIHKHATVEVTGSKRSHVVFDYARGAD